MASYNMHLAFAKLVGEKLNIDNKDFYIGSLAPDICKKEFWEKRKTHFGDEFSKVYLDKFLQKYGDKLDNPFIMGYLVHIYFDEKFFEEFLSNYFEVIEGKYNTTKYARFKEKKTGKIMEGKEVFGKRFYDNYDYINENLVRKYDLPNRFDLSEDDIIRYSVIDEYDARNLLGINDELGIFKDYKNESIGDIIYTFEEFDHFINEQANLFAITYGK